MFPHTKAFVSIRLSKSFDEIMFQIAALYIHSKTFGRQITIPDNNSFIEETKMFDTKVIETYYEVNDQDDHKIVPYGENVMLIGKFKSFKKYDEDTLEFMRHFIYANEEYMWEAYNKYCNIKNKFGIEDDEMVSLYFDNTDENINIGYYKKSVILMNKKHIVIFAKDASKLMRIFEDFHNVQIVWDNNIYIRFIILSLFKHNIVQYYDSYYSLWAAYISKYDDVKTVVLPDYIKRIINPTINNVNIVYLD